MYSNPFLYKILYVAEHTSLHILFHTVFPTTLTVLGEDRGDGLLCPHSQTPELPPMGSLVGPIFAVLPQAAKTFLFRQTFP